MDAQPASLDPIRYQFVLSYKEIYLVIRVITLGMLEPRG